MQTKQIDPGTILAVMVAKDMQIMAMAKKIGQLEKQNEQLNAMVEKAQPVAGKDIPA